MEPITFTPGTLVVLIGPSASGKSTFAEQYPVTWSICLDTLRGCIADDEADQSATGVAAHVQNALLDARLARARTTIVNATNLLPHVRAALLARARYWQRPAHAVLFTLPLADCQQRNQNRTRRVPADVLRWQHTIVPTASQLADEGFTYVHHA